MKWYFMQGQIIQKANQSSHSCLEHIALTRLTLLYNFNKIFLWPELCNEMVLYARADN